jgi:hypothetical protein
MVICITSGADDDAGQSCERGHYHQWSTTMAADLVSLIMQFVTPGMTTKIASALGLPRESMDKAVAAAVPAILAAFANTAMKPGGGQQISNAFAQQSGTLDRIKNAIGTGSEKPLIDKGSDLMSSVLGSSGSNALAGALGRFTGLDTGASKSLLGILGPVAASVIGQQQRSADLDAKGLTDLLSSQKDQIANAMPAGLGKALAGTGLLDNLGSTFQRGSAAVSDAASRASEMPDAAVAHAAQAARGATRSLPYLLLALAAAGILGWFFLGRDTTEQVAERPAAPATRTSETVGAGAPDRLTDLTAELTSSVSAVRSALDGMTDPASVRDALPRLQQATARLEAIGNSASQLPPNARKEISFYVVRSMPALNQLCDKVLASPEAAPLAKPAIDALRVRLAELSRS